MIRSEFSRMMEVGNERTILASMGAYMERNGRREGRMTTPRTSSE